MSMSTLSQQRGPEEFKEEFLTCSICSELYDNDEHKALFLPFLHSFCRSCLRKHAEKRKILECPMCRCEVKDKSADRLPVNFIVQNLMAYKDLLNMSVSCGNCDIDGVVAVSFCHHCGCFLCQNCVQYHQKIGPIARDHKLSTMEELQESRYNPKVQTLYCQKHPKKELTIFC